MRLVKVGSALAVLLGLAWLAQAQEGKKAKKLEGTRGEVISVDNATKTFVFRTGKKKDPTAQEITIQFDDKTQFVKLGDAGTENAQSQDIAARKRLVVVYETKDNKNVATKVTLLERSKKKKAA
jgi:hypothetical protein